jgi:hypothetical protein
MSLPHDRAATAHAKRDIARSENRRRLASVAFVALAVGGLLAASAVFEAAPLRNSEGSLGGRLPEASLPSNTAAQWDCPGPLPAGSSPQRSAVLLTNPGKAPASVVVAAVATSTAASSAGQKLPGWSKTLVLPPRSSRELPLATTGPSQDDAVSVLSASAAVAVFESVVSAPKRNPVPAASPCEAGTASASYIGAGSTLGRSSVIVSVFDPTATPAVVGIRVSTGAKSVLPPTLQGLIIKPYSLQIFNLGRWVVQQPTLGVTVSASVGRVAVGAAETEAPNGRVSGSGLLIAVDQTASVWVMPPGVIRAGRSVAVRIFDPGVRSAMVTISSPLAGRAPIELTDNLVAGGVLDVSLPLRASATKKGKASSPAAAGAPAVEGPIVVRTAEGVGVVVSRITALPYAGQDQAATFAAATSVPSRRWVLPAATGVFGKSGLREHLVLSNPHNAVASARVEVLRAGSGAVSTIAIPANSTATLAVGSSRGHLLGAVLVLASASVIAEAEIFASHGAFRPSPVEGVPIA